ncbi:hypothetical protein KEM55_001602 [Ascosphaera atra]|nr:hypothetical protein KEM55_001602 [Ascosphaera atra]
MQTYQKKYDGRSEYLKIYAKQEFTKEVKTLGDDARAWLAEENSRMEAAREEERRKEATEQQKRLILKAFDRGQQPAAGTVRDSANGNANSGSGIVAVLEEIKEELKGWGADVKEALQYFQKQKEEDRKAMLEFTSSLDQLLRSALRDGKTPAETPKKSIYKRSTPVSTIKNTPRSRLNDDDEEDAERKRHRVDADDDQEEDGEDDGGDDDGEVNEDEEAADDGEDNKEYTEEVAEGAEKHFELGN